LKSNQAKSSLLFGGVPSTVKNDILEFLHMHEGKLPIRYLGVPIFSKRLTTADCDILVSKIAGCIDSWLARNLSFAGRLQLVSSVLLSIGLKFLFFLKESFFFFNINLTVSCGVEKTLRRMLKFHGISFVILKEKVG